MKRGHSIDVVMTLMLFGLFTASVLMVLMLGIQSYQGVVTAMEESYEERTCLQYIATKVNHYSGEGNVALTQFGDGTALALRETIDGDQYTTYLYHYDGVMMELFCEADATLDPDAGFFVLEMEEFEVTEVSDNLLSITCTGSGGSAQLYVALGEGEVALSWVQ